MLLPCFFRAINFAQRNRVTCQGGNALVDYCKVTFHLSPGVFHAIGDSGGGKSQ